MFRSSLIDEIKWISHDASLNELMERYPDEWKLTGAELVSALEDGRTQTLEKYAAKAGSIEETWQHRIRDSRNNTKVLESAKPHIIRSRMAILAIRQCCQAAALGKATGKVRFNLINGFIIQRLLFSRHLTRKPVSLKQFRFWWRFVTQKRLLMPLVQPEGIYCFYSRELIDALCALIGDRKCLEIGAGDGTLARFLAEKGLNIRATDDYSWKHAIKYPQEVEMLGAKQALEKYEPQVVICSWPPHGNNFEQKIFSTRSVELYIVIGSMHRFSAGNWESYAAQDRFKWEIDKNLSSLVIPPEIDGAVIVFNRKSA